MNNPESDALNAVLAADRPSGQRLQLLQTLSNELRGEKAVLALLAAAREEKTLELRQAFFAHASECDITRITDRKAFIDGILYFAAIEEEAALRKIALGKLGPWSGYDAAILDILFETLVCELDVEIQRVCIAGLAQCAARNPEYVQKLLQFVPRSPAALRRPLIDLLARFDAQSLQAGLVLLLDPSEKDEVRAYALNELAFLPKLEPKTLEALQSLVLNESNEALQTSAVKVLRNSKQISPELFKVIFDLFVRFPERADLLEAIRRRLASFPGLLKNLTDLFQTVRSAHTRVRILELLEEVPAVPLFIWALHDPSPQVRSAAIASCKHHQAGNAAAIERAVVDAARNESVVSVREAMASLFGDSVRRDEQVNRELVEWLERETEPRVERVLAGALTAIPLSSSNGPAILCAYRKILSDASTSEELRAAIVARLANVAFQDQPELTECVKLLIRRSGKIEEVESLYARLREMEPDIHAHADLILTLFFRFVGEYPREPLRQWLNDFEKLAPTHPQIRSQIPYIVRLTGASWLSGAAVTSARKAVFLPALLEQMRQGNWIEAGRLLRDSWEQRTIRKSDMLALFKKLLRAPGEESLMQSCLVMMAKGGMATPDVLDMCFSYLEEEPRNGTYTYLISEFVQGNNQDTSPMKSIGEVRVDLKPARLKDPHYREKVFSQFDQHHLNRYYRLLPEEMELPPRPKNWNEWEYLLWPDKGLEWKIAQMFFELKPHDRISALLASPVDPVAPPARSIHYLLLLYLWKETGDGLAASVVDGYLRGLFALIKNTAGKRSQKLLHDRAILVFQRYWSRQVNNFKGGRSVDSDLAEMAAEVYIMLCEISAKFDAPAEQRFPAELPELLQGLSARHLESLWTLDRPAWDRLYKEHFEGAEADETARLLYEKATAAEEEGRFEEAFPLYQDFLANHSATRFGKLVRSSAQSSLEYCDPNKPIGKDLDEGARIQYEILMSKVDKDKPDRVLHSLNWMRRNYWRSAFLADKRADLETLRKTLLTKLPA